MFHFNNGLIKPPHKSQTRRDSDCPACSPSTLPAYKPAQSL